MSYLELYTTSTLKFGGAACKFKDSEYVIIGVPIDYTSSYRSGSRFAPLAIREASLNIEGLSFRTWKNVDDLKIHDAGDLHISADLKETLRRLELVTGEVLGEGKTPILIGGEHTLTLGSTKGIREDFNVLCFDAHLDLRNEYMEQRISHATVMRRIHEYAKPQRIIMVGTRAACEEEIAYAKENEICFISSYEINREGARDTSRKIKELLGDEEPLYLSLDLDVLDPAFAPAVQTPEPEGISTYQLLEIISNLNFERLIALDLVEVTPHYDSGVTVIVAAKIIFEILSLMSNLRDKTRSIEGENPQNIN